MSDVVVDIEVVGPEFDQLDEPTRDYLLKRAKTDEDRAEVPERLALQFGIGEIVAISMHSIDTGITLVLMNGADRFNLSVDDGTVIEFGDERQILQRFWKVLCAPRKADGKPETKRLITYNGRGYDGPMLMIRSAQLGVEIRRGLVPYRYDLAEHCDIAEVLNFQGTVRNFYSLDYWCRRFNIESPKDGGVSGADVGRLYREGDLQTIAAYAARDARATAALYKAVMPIAAWFKGGPRYVHEAPTAQESLPFHVTPPAEAAVA